MDLKGKVALVTGGASDIGMSIVESLARLNCNVVINYNTSENAANKLKEKLEGNVKVLLIKADISNEDEVKSMIDKVIDEFGRIDILINNAAYTSDSSIYEKSKKEFMRVLEVNVWGTFSVSKYASIYMNEGIIINISSTDAVDTYNEYNIDYSLSKAAINSLTKSLALVLPNIKVLALMPLFVNTEIVKNMDKDYLEYELKRTNQKRLLDASEVSDKVIELINSDIKSGSIIRMEE